MKLKVVKFGGSSLADAAHFRNAAQIIKSDSSRKYVVVSAPGKRFDGDVKVTDLLLESMTSPDAEGVLNTVARRFREIISGLGLKLSIEEDIKELKRAAELGKRDFLVSRGEYLSAKIMAALLGFDFLDAALGIRFAEPCQCDWDATRSSLKDLLNQGANTVIPGFYGADAQGNVCTFLRGGSDITGAVVADAVDADLYENWTDVSGVLAADPHLVPDPRPISVVTYDELHTFSHLGAKVLHEDAIFPCRRSGIPIQIRNSNRAWETGTMVVPSNNDPFTLHRVGVGLRKDVSVLSVRCSVEMCQKILDLIGAEKSGLEYLSATAQGIKAVGSAQSMSACENKLHKMFADDLNKAAVTIKHDLGLIGVVGKVPRNSDKAKNRVAGALDRAGIEAELVDCAFDDSCVMAVVSKPDCGRAVQTLYRQFIPACNLQRKYKSEYQRMALSV